MNRISRFVYKSDTASIDYAFTSYVINGLPDMGSILTNVAFYNDGPSMVLVFVACRTWTYADKQRVVAYLKQAIDTKREQWAQVDFANLKKEIESVFECENVVVSVSLEPLIQAFDNPSAWLMAIEHKEKGENENE